MRVEVKNIVDKFCPISENSFLKMEDIFHFETISKGQTFITKDKPNKKEYFVLNGICKSYLINPDGDEVSISFFTENTVLSPHSIRTSKNYANQYFKALTDLELVSMDAAKFEKLMIEDEGIRNFGNAVLQNELKEKVQKEIGLASLTASERLVVFREKHKLLENLIPHTDIASYLGITNISLSRLRNKLSK